MFPRIKMTFYKSFLRDKIMSNTYLSFLQLNEFKIYISIHNKIVILYQNRYHEKLGI